MSNFAREVKPPPPDQESLSLDPKRAIQSAAKALIPGLPFNVGSVFDHKGVIAGLDTEGFASKPILQMPAMQGGVLARIAGALTKNTLNWQEMSIDALGSLTPSDSPSMGREAVMER